MREGAAALPAAFLKTLWRGRTLRTRAAIARYQQAGLRGLIRHAARTTTFYAPYAAARLDDLPVVDKAAMLADFAAFNTLGLDRDTAWRVIGGSTQAPGFEVGASTGTSGLRGLYVVAAAERFRWLGTMLAKVLPDVMTSRHRVAIILPGPSPLYQSANESRLLALAHFDPRGGPERLIPDIAVFAPTVLLGAPKSLRVLATAATRLHPRKVVVAAEVLDPADAAIVERAFGTVPGQVYMATEGLLGTSCRYGHLHLAEDIAAFELEPVADDPTLVTPLFTDFTRRTQIMARYRLGDLLRVVEAPCPCGSAMLRVRVIGRHADLITLPPRADAAPLVLAPDRLRDIVTSAAPGLDDYRIGLAAETKALRVLLPLSTSAAYAKAVTAALVDVTQGSESTVEVARVELRTPFDRKLRRIAPVPPETL